MADSHSNVKLGSCVTPLTIHRNLSSSYNHFILIGRNKFQKVLMTCDKYITKKKLKNKPIFRMIRFFLSFYHGQINYCHTKQNGC